MKKIIIILAIIGILIYFDLNQNKIDFKEVEIDIEKTDKNYIEVTNSRELLSALENDSINIINIKNDIDLGFYNVDYYSRYIKEHNKALTHPKLKASGISKLVLKNKSNLIITSTTGSKLLHTNIVIDNGKNIKIHNIELAELWEWDEKTKANYDINDWDAISIRNSNNILIDHITFNKVYDGITDINDSKNITIKNCKLNNTDINDNYFNDQFVELEDNKNKYPMYKYLRDDVKLSIDQIKKLSSYQYKLFLIGTKDYGSKNKNIVIHDNMFLNVKTRIPQARNSSVYFYNNYIDSSNISYDIISKKQKEMVNTSKYQKLVHLGTYGIISIQRSYVVSENNIFKGVDYPYTKGRDSKYKNIGRIIIKEDKEILSKLKDRLDKNVGVKRKSN